MQNKMRRVYIALCLIVILACSLFYLGARTSLKNILNTITEEYTPNDSLKYFFAKNSLRGFDWKDKDNIELITNSWQPYAEDHWDHHDRTFLKEMKNKLYGHNFISELFKYNENNRYEFLLLSNYKPSYTASDEQYDLKFCATSTQNITQLLGSATRKLDVSENKENEDYSFVDISSYWDFGNTHVLYLCKGSRIFKKFVPAFVAVVIGSKEDVDELKPLTLLKCSMKVKGFGAFDRKPMEEQAPFTAIVNPNTNSITSRTIRMGDTTTFTDQEIISQSEDALFSGFFRLDRASGAYIFKTTSKDVQFKNSGIDRWGDCEKIDPNKKI